MATTPMDIDLRSQTGGAVGPGLVKHSVIATAKITETIKAYRPTRVC